MDQRVEIHGTSRTDMNGKCGVATDFHPHPMVFEERSQDRYVVRLDSGEAFKLKPANVRAEGTGTGAGAGAGAGAGSGRGQGEGQGQEGQEGAWRALVSYQRW